MAKYDWIKLKKEYVTGSYASLTAFARAKGISPHTLKQNTAGWIAEKKKKDTQKAERIIEGATDREVRREIDRNTRHMEAYDMALEAVFDILSLYKDKRSKKDVYSLEKLISALERIQKGQRLGEGKRADTSLMESLVEVMDNAKD